MPNAPYQRLDNCTHERRPGTTVCLHCRHAARERAAARRRKIFLRAGSVTIVIAAIVVAATFGATAIRTRIAARGLGSSELPQQGTTPAIATEPATDTPNSAATVAAAPTVPTVATVAAAPTASVSAPVVAGGPPITPVIAEGESPLVDSVTVFRADSAIIVSFDAPTVRTRNGERFETLLRKTLPVIYGRSIDTVLAKMPTGSISRQGDLVGELPLRGATIPLDSGWVIHIVPETRPSAGGPIVIRYRVRVARAA